MNSKTNIFRKILIANRGEIASRIIRGANELGIKTLVIYSFQDAHLDFVKESSQSILLEGKTIPETYLNIKQIIEIAKKHKVDAIHPGYGFLSENADFARECEQNNITFIGPSADSIDQMGDKIRAREIAEASSVPVLKAITGSPDEILKNKLKLEYPLLIKASAGGGGKGMKVVWHEEELGEALSTAQLQALTYFGNDTIYLEKYLDNPKHIEVQIFGDNFGNLVHLFERECSIQRRHQKIIEESPSPKITKELRDKLTTAALNLARKINYKNAGTIEFLVQGDEFYFLEMNTRIQVEHPVTEETTRIDLVKEQILVAQGNPLSFKQENISIKKHSIQLRIYAEDPKNQFRPSPGEITLNSLPGEDLCRIDTISKNENFIVPSDFDPMLSKLICSGNNRDEAIQNINIALDKYILHGIKNNISYLKQILNENDFKVGDTDTKYIDNHHTNLIKEQESSLLNITSVVPILATYFVGNSIKSSNKNIWNTIGRWKAIDLISGIINGEEVQCQIVSKSDNKKIVIVENQFGDLKIDLVSDNKIELQYNNTKYNCVVSQSKQNNQFEVTVNSFHFNIERNDILRNRSLEEYLSEKKVSSSINSNGFVKSPLNGKAIKINFKNGDKVIKGDTLLVIESMKTENKIIAEHGGTVAELAVLEGDQVKGEQLLLRLN